MSSSPYSVHRRRRGFELDFGYFDARGRKRRYRRLAEVQTLAAARAEASRRYQLAMEFGSPDGRPPGPTVSVFFEGAYTEERLVNDRPETVVCKLGVYQ